MRARNENKKYGKRDKGCARGTRTRNMGSEIRDAREGREQEIQEARLGMRARDENKKYGKRDKGCARGTRTRNTGSEIRDARAREDDSLLS